jgi:hypothetical protein
VTKLGTALREKFHNNPKLALQALGLDESLIRDAHRTENTMTAKPTRLAATLLALTASHIKPVLAKDAKIDLLPVFAGITTKNFKAKDVKLALDSALKGKLAKDASIQHVADMLDALEPAMKQESADESVSEAQHNAMGAAAGGNSNLGIPKGVGEEFMKADKGKTFDAEPLKNFLKEKGLGDEDITKAMDMLPKPAMDEETEEEKAAKAAAAKAAQVGDKSEEEKAAKEAAKAAEDALKAKDEEMKDMVKKPAMDAAIKAAKAEVRDTERKIRAALQDVKPFVGEISPSMAFDSAEDVYKQALTMRNVEIKDVHPSAFRAMLSLLPKAGAKPVEREQTLGMDAAAVDAFAKKYPGSERIQSA